MNEKMTLKVINVDQFPKQHIIESNHQEMEHGEFEDRYVNFSGHFGRLGPHIFAAAPELLEALEKAWPLLEEYDGMVGDDSCHQEAINAARAAIAKAKGEQP